jgi:hypothetical protein
MRTTATLRTTASCFPPAWWWSGERAWMSGLGGSSLASSLFYRCALDSLSFSLSIRIYLVVRLEAEGICMYFPSFLQMCLHASRLALHIPKPLPFLSGSQEHLYRSMVAVHPTAVLLMTSCRVVYCTSRVKERTTARCILAEH